MPGIFQENVIDQKSRKHAPTMQGVYFQWDCLYQNRNVVVPWTTALPKQVGSLIMKNELVLRPRASASPGSWLKMQTRRPYLEPVIQESAFNKMLR